MKEYVMPIVAASITFILLAQIGTLPFIIYQYRKHGYINKWRAVILYSFVLYALVAYYLVILPLPKTRDVRSLFGADHQIYQLVPFQFISDILKETGVIWSNPKTYFGIFTERAFLQTVFNAILLLPLGVYVRYYFRKSLKQTIVISFLVSLFFELTQLTGLYGIYNAPYRIFDIDDLILNTSGGFLGFIVAPIFTYFLPKSDQLDANVELQAISVGFVRRIIAVFIDMCVIHILWIWDDTRSDLLVQGIMIFLYFIVFIYYTQGYTLGKWLTRIRVCSETGRLTFRQLVTRYGLLYYGFFGISQVLNRVLKSHVLKGMDLRVLILIIIVFEGMFVLHFLATIFKKKKRLFYEKISQTYNCIAVK